MYCETCNILTDKPRCPICGNRHLRYPYTSDYCYLTEQPLLWSEMLEDVLKQSGIPVYSRRTMGAGMTLSVGQMMESVRFYVPYGRLEEAGELVSALFNAPEEIDE